MPTLSIPAIGRRIARFDQDERGATAIEYALIAAGISIVIAGTVFSIGDDLKTSYFDKIIAAFYI